MADQEMLTVFSYDVARSGVRRKVAALLEEHGVRVQKSVFEAMLTARAARALTDAALALLDDGDSLRVYAIAAAGRSRCRVQGGAPQLESGIYYLV